MHHTALTTSLLLMAACGPVKLDDSASDDGATSPDTATGDDTGPATSDDTDDTDAPDTDDTTGEDTQAVDDTASADDTGDTSGADTGPPTSPVSALSWSVHDEVNTLIEVRFTLDEAAEAWVAFSFDGKNWEESPARTLEAGEHDEVLFGIPADMDLDWEVRTLVAGAETASEPQEARTESLPSNLPLPVLLDWNPAESGSEGWLYTSVEAGNNNFFGPYYALILDREGRVVWYHSPEDDRLAMFPRIAPDGSHVLIDQTSIYAGGTTPELLRTTLDGAQTELIHPAHWNLTYDYLPDGTMLYDDSTDGTRYHLTALRPDGTEEQLWSCYDWMSEIKTVRSWDCQPNTILWNEDTNTVLWSMFQTSTVVEVDLDSGEVIRQFGQLDGSWTMDPFNAMLELQHFPNYSADGTLMVSTHIVGQRGRQVAREFAVNDKTETLEEIWSFENDLGYYAEYAGEAKRLDSGNTLVGLGTDGAILEVTPDGDVAWGIEFAGRLVGQATLVDDLYALNEGW